MMPLFDFGTANFEAPEGKKTGFFIGVERDAGQPQPNKFSKDGEDVVNVNPFAILIAGAPVVLLTTVVLALVLTTPGNQLPFNFLDGFYPPRVAEMKQIREKKDKAEAIQKAEADKAKAAAEAKAKAEAEAKAAEEAKAAKTPAAAKK
jgi:hypothetical protein